MRAAIEKRYVSLRCRALIAAAVREPAAREWMKCIRDIDVCIRVADERASHALAI